jgi:hypothetical protein
MGGSITLVQRAQYNALRAEYLKLQPMGYTDFIIDGDVMLMHCGGGEWTTDWIIRQDGSFKENV